MTLSRRSFLKMAGLSTVVAAGAVMFTGCSVAVVLQITNEKGDLFPTEESQEILKKVNSFLKLVPIPFVNSVKVADVKAIIQKAMQSVPNAPTDKEIVVTNADDEGYITATDSFIGVLTIDLALADANSSEAATLSL